MVASPRYVETILSAFARATEANRRMPGRVGASLIVSPDWAAEVMVTGDIHGNRLNFNRLRKIAALDEHPKRLLILQEVCHGGPVYSENGGCMSHAILEDVAEFALRHPRQVHLLLGNHEMAELTDFPIRKNNQLLNLLFRLGLHQMYGSAAEEVRQAALRYLWSCPVAVRLPNGVLIAHSLPDGVDRRGFDPTALTRALTPEDGAEGSDVFRLLWGRDYRRENARAFCERVGAKLLITGHEPCEEGFIAPNDRQVILDCCGDKCAFVILPVEQPLDQADILNRIEVLGEDR